MEERTFTETELRRLLWIIGYVMPLDWLGRTYNELSVLLHDRAMDFATDAPLIRIARGVWCDAGSYGVGSLHDEDCDLGKEGRARLVRRVAIEEEMRQSGEDF
jgi:hypothetical protein